MRFLDADSKTLDPTSLRRLHFVGIGGAGMSGIALVLKARGYEITGSDLKPSRYVTLLREAGVKVSIGHRAQNVDHPDAVVISSAIPVHNIEVQEAKRQGVPIVKRAQALGWVVNNGNGIAVCGTHGKTTTTSMIAHALCEAGLDPTFLVGGELNDFGSNARHGSGPFVVCEADESDGSFLFLRPRVVVLTNIELDHHSFYLHVSDVEDAFCELVRRIPAEGLVVYCCDDPILRRVVAKGSCTRCSYGFGEDADYRAADISLWGRGSTFKVLRSGKQILEVSLQVPGKHNVLNALGALATLVELGVSPEVVARALGSFRGAARRFEIKGEKNGVTVVDDYAHHPTEIKATLEAARVGKWSRIVAVFQPHLYSRTEFLSHDFAQALIGADVVVVTDVYGAREEPLPGVTGKLIVDALAKISPHKQVVYLPRLREVVRYLESATKPGDLVLTIGAGDIHSAGERFLAGNVQ